MQQMTLSCQLSCLDFRTRCFGFSPSTELNWRYWSRVSPTYHLLHHRRIRCLDLPLGFQTLTLPLSSVLALTKTLFDSAAAFSLGPRWSRRCLLQVCRLHPLLLACCWLPRSLTELGGQALNHMPCLLNDSFLLLALAAAPSWRMLHASSLKMPYL